MAVILESERKSFKARVFLALIYSVLSLGAVTMVYPFAVMIAGSFSSAYDYNRQSPIVSALFSKSDRFMRSIATYFKAFPHEVYPDAPETWTTWTEVAKDTKGVRLFAERELEAYKNAEFLAESKEIAREYLLALKKVDPLLLSCHYDQRDVPRFAREKYGTIENLNKAWDVPHKSLFDISFSAEARLKSGMKPLDAAKASDYQELKKRYVDEAIAHGDFMARTVPSDLKSNAADIRNALAVQFCEHGTSDFLKSALGNYRLIGDYLFLRGGAFFNTLILVVLSILATLTVNPLAAYALSRFRLKSTESIILFILATMAFPAAVTAIPGFLLLRDLGMLNTFAALVLPTMANGMSIFILKGFFDALPRELYEAAAIDGASEWTVFRRITLPMMTPILAVNALNAFIHAYASWEWAFLVCHKESHWTLAVWLYQMSVETFAGQPWCVMAGFVVVSIPTAVVFLLCQKIILRGIVLPSMK